MMKKILLPLYVAFLLLLISTQSFAVTVKKLYEAELPVAAQTDDLKAQAIKDGFLQILVKLTGDPEITKNPTISEALKRSDYYVQELGYSAATTTSSQYTIQIHYEMNDVNRLLKKAGVSYWGTNRPLILVWLLVNRKNQSPEIIGNEMPGDTFTLMRQQGRQYGLPLIFPMMDVTDMTLISANEITTMAVPELEEAGKRYAPDAILIGKMDENNFGYQSQWQLILGKNQWKWKLTDKTMEGAVASIMNEISQALSKQYVVKEVAKVTDQLLKLEVMNVTQRDDLNQLLKFLKQLFPLVQKVELAQVSSDVVDLSLQIRGSVNAFINNAAVNQKLNLKYQDRAENRLVYVWVH